MTIEEIENRIAHLEELIRVRLETDYFIRPEWIIERNELVSTHIKMTENSLKLTN